MTSVLRRLSDASATSLMCSGRLFWQSSACSGPVHHWDQACNRTWWRSPPGHEVEPALRHEVFVCEGTIAFGGVEKCDATFDSRPDQRDHFLLVACRTVANGHSHTAEPESRDFQVAVSKFARFHCFLSLGICLIPRLRANVLQAVG